MAIAFADWTIDHNQTPASPQTLTYPATIASLDLLVLAMTMQFSKTVTGYAGNFTELDNETNGINITQNVSYRVADGTEDGTTFDITFNADSAIVWSFGRFTGCADPAVSAPDIGTPSEAETTTPDPPSLTLSGPSQERLMFLPLASDCGASSNTVSGYPTNYSGDTFAENQFGRMIATAYRIATLSTSENPDTFSVANDDHHIVNTFGFFAASSPLSFFPLPVMRFG